MRSSEPCNCCLYSLPQVDEVQYIRCDLTPDSTPRFTLSFRGAVSAPFSGDISAAQLDALLESLPTIGTTSVTYGAGTTFCNVDNLGTVPPSANWIGVTFLSDHGPLPSLLVLDEHGQLLTGAEDNAVDMGYAGATGTPALVYSTGPGTTATQTAVQGTKESAPCSNRGTCDRGTGLCTCFTGFSASNGVGNVAGSEPNCGYITALGDPTSITQCPGKSGLIECSGHGTCDAVTHTCTCDHNPDWTGWTGGDCSQRLCPLGGAWFDFPSATDTAHALAECSNKGACNRATGVCTCQAMFEGSACERMTCPGKLGNGAACNGHGQCLPMSALAQLYSVNGEAAPVTYGADPTVLATWDTSKVYGCACDVGYGGYDCSQAQCAVGEDTTAKEWNVLLTDEVQTLKCIDVGGSTAGTTFKLQFRDKQTAAIPYDATAATIEAALEALDSIGDIAVTATTGGATVPGLAACTASPGTVITFSFSTEHGDVPPLRVVMSGAGAGGYWAAGQGWDDTMLQVRMICRCFEALLVRSDFSAPSDCRALNYSFSRIACHLHFILMTCSGRVATPPRPPTILPPTCSSRAAAGTTPQVRAIMTLLLLEDRGGSNWCENQQQ